MQPLRDTRNAPCTPVHALIVGAAIVPLAGCTTVGDRITGVSLERAMPTSCIQQCNNSYRTLSDQEERRHNANVEVCRGLPRTESGACIGVEGARHTAEMERLGGGLTDCQSSCQHAGEGSAG